MSNTTERDRADTATVPVGASLHALQSRGSGDSRRGSRGGPPPRVHRGRHRPPRPHKGPRGAPRASAGYQRICGDKRPARTHRSDGRGSSHRGPHITHQCIWWIVPVSAPPPRSEARRGQSKFLFRAANVNESSSQIDFVKPSPGQGTTAWWLVVDPLRKKRVAGAQLTPGIRDR
jgi:hypothetical protein